MKIVKIGSLIIGAPLVATLLLFIFSLIETALRSFLGIENVIEGTQLPESVGYILFFFIFLSAHLVFLFTIFVSTRFGNKKRRKLVLLYSLATTILVSWVFHAPETGDLFYETFFVIGLFVGFPICISEWISEKFLLQVNI